MFPDALFLSAALLWLFVVGSTVGSFLNVVVYRMPAGLSLLFPSSHCPACKTPIRLRDNVPILGWLLLRGQCRDCRVHISARYPLVELATGLIFVVLAWFEPLSNDMNLPWIGFLRARPAFGQDNLTVANLWSIYAFHLLLLCSLLTAALIEYDGHGLPSRLVMIPLIIGFVGPIVWPWLKPVTGQTGQVGFWGRLDYGGYGIAVGAVVALLIQRVTENESVGKAAPIRPYTALMWAGAFLGGRGCLIPAAIAACVFLVAQWCARFFPKLERLPWSGWFGLFVMVWIIQWRSFDALLPDAVSLSDVLIFPAVLALIGALSWLTQQVRIGNFQRRCGM